MLERLAKRKIQEWLKTGKDAFMLTGARQIGKTYLIRECLKESGFPYVEINFIEQPQLVDVFSKAKDAKELLMRLSLTANGKLKKGKTIIFLDEVQEFKDIVTRVKFLVEEGSFRYIMSGSLLGVELNDLRSAPVGYMEIYDMYPMGFKEFALAVGINKEIFEMLEEKFPNKAVIIFSADRSCCIMNQKARNIYQFSAETCYPESYYRIMREYLNDREFIKKEFSDYMKMMNSRGVTTVKEMGFDDFYGFTDYLKELEDSEDLNLRTFFMSQPVGEGMNLVYARRMREQFTGDKIRFSGFNRMTDGTIASYKGDLKEPYENQDFCCKDPVPYEEIEKDVLAADAEDFRWSYMHREMVQ